MTDSPPASASTIVVFGASYAKDWPIKQIDDARVVNAGIGGNETKDMLARYEKDVLARQPQRVLLWGFINDFTRSQAKDAARVAEGVKQRYIQMIDQASARGIRPIVATEVTLPRATSWSGEMIARVYGLLGRTGYADRINKEVMQVNAWLKQYAAERQIPVLDFQSALSSDGFFRDRAYTLEDGSHFTPAAYEALTDYLRKHEQRL